ncbi:MAG: hypothetical protein GX129_00190 [Clostridiales bacterium]|jgi:hypothetical protein|nr:hypothetical protein [Clostridiales bacterium]
MMICIGYIGVEAFDIILYIGKSISKLNYQVLIIDLSDTGALTKTIYHGMDLDSRDDIIQYRDLNYTKKIPDEKELKEFEDGVLFVVYGFDNIDRYRIHLDFLNIVVNPFPHNIYKVNSVLHNSSLENINARVLIRDIVTIDDVDRVIAAIKSELSPVRTMYLYYDINDYENALKCQISQAVRFRKISPNMRKIIMTEIGDLLPNIKPSIIRKAVCKARRGDRCR